MRFRKRRKFKKEAEREDEDGMTPSMLRLILSFSEDGADREGDADRTLDRDAFPRQRLSAAAR